MLLTGWEVRVAKNCIRWQGAVNKTEGKVFPHKDIFFPTFASVLDNPENLTDNIILKSIIDIMYARFPFQEVTV